MFSYLAHKVWNAQRSVYLLQSDAIRIVQQRIQLVQERSLVALTLTGSGRHKEIIQGIAKLASTTHTGKKTWLIINCLFRLCQLKRTDNRP